MLTEFGGPEASGVYVVGPLPSHQEWPMGTKPPQPTFTPSKGGTCYLGKASVTQGNYQYLAKQDPQTRILQQSTRRQKTHGTLHCTHPHTPTTQHTLSARFVEKPCTGSCLPKEHGAVRPGSLRNNNNKNNYNLASHRIMLKKKIFV